MQNDNFEALVTLLMTSIDRGTQTMMAVLLAAQRVQVNPRRVYNAAQKRMPRDRVLPPYEEIAPPGVT